MTPEQILKITNPKQLFNSSDNELLFRKLAMVHHPDKGGDAHVFAHIKKLYDLDRKNKLKRKFSIKDISGIRTVLYREKVESFELGEESIGLDFILYSITQENIDLLHNFMAKVDSLYFINKKVEEYFKPLLPVISKKYNIADGAILLLKKPVELIRLKDLKDHLNIMPERHVAWIITRLLNLCVYLQKHNISHNGISTESLYINPELHTVHLLGGWFYSAELGSKMLAVPNKTLEYAPSSLIRSKVGDIRTDLEMTKAVARELLGDISGSSLYRNSNIPKPMLDWLRQPCTSDALTEYANWHTDGGVLDKSFGPKKFIELKVTFNDVY